MLLRLKNFPFHGLGKDKGKGIALSGTHYKLLCLLLFLYNNNIYFQLDVQCYFLHSLRACVFNSAQHGIALSVALYCLFT